MDSMRGCLAPAVICRTEGPGWCRGQNTRAIVPAPVRDYGDNASTTVRGLLSGLGQAVLILDQTLAVMHHACLAEWLYSCEPFIYFFNIL